MFAHLEFSFPMTLIYNICELHQHQHQSIICGFCHNRISILVQTFFYTMYQNAISTGVLFMPVYDTIKILNCFIHISCHFSQFTRFLLFITVSLQFVKFFTIEFYCFDKVSEQVFTFNLVIPSWVTWFILQISFILALMFFIQLSRICKHSGDFILLVKTCNETLDHLKLTSRAFSSSSPLQDWSLKVSLTKNWKIFKYPLQSVIQQLFHMVNSSNYRYIKKKLLHCFRR